MNEPTPEDRSSLRTTKGARPLLRWHRRIGLALAVLFFAMVGTGLLLNHSEDLGLRQRVLHADWLYRWYGMQPATKAQGFLAGEHWVVAVDRSVSVNTTQVADFGPVRGAIALGDTIVVAAPGEVLLLAADGALIERMTRAALPAGLIQRVGRPANGEGLVLETDAGVFCAGPDMLKWSPCNQDASMAVNWSAATQPPESLVKSALAAYRGESLTVHRLMLDLHSGRFFGRAGVVLVDLAGIGLLFLALSGVWYTWRTRRRRESL